MTKHESAELAKFLKGLFPQVTEAEALLLAEDARHMEFNRVVEVVKTHKRQHDFFSHKGLYEALVGDHVKHLKGAAPDAHERVIDTLRLDYPALANLSDRDALATHFNRGAKAVREAKAPDANKVRILGMIEAHAAKALIEIGVTEAEAVALAKEWAGQAVPA